MTDEPISLEPANEGSAPLISNLLELYVHDLSEIFPVEIGVDGRFGYDRLPLYWSAPDTHFAFVIRIGDRPAGFILVTRGSVASDDPDVLDVSEFFVLRSHRREGVGSRAAFLLWNRLPAQWIVRVSDAHTAGQLFWEATIRTYTGGFFSTAAHSGKHHTFRVFSFRSDGTRAK
jgi:predicted acetyltransferase